MPPTTTTETTETTRIRGVVKWFQPSQLNRENYGFITKPNGEDIFVHGKNVADEDYPLSEGESVEFVIKNGRDGRPTAKDVRRVNSVLPASFKFPGS